MARRKKEKVILENIELKPQVIGYTYKKKSNIGRIIFMFIIFALVVYYINDISVFINNIIGKNSSDSIKELAGNKNKKPENEKENIEKEEDKFYIYENNLNFVKDEMTLNNFNLNNNKLMFNIVNNTDKTIEIIDKNYFIELYSENKTLLERIKVDINIINEQSKISYELDVNNSFYYIMFVRKNIDDYPMVNLNSDESGYAQIKCFKGIDEIVYKFRNEKLESIKHTISDSNTLGENYYMNYTAYQNKTANYNNITGITATFNGTLNGYTAVIEINLSQVDSSNLDEKYYYKINELPKVVKFEMQTYGFTCE